MSALFHKVGITDVRQMMIVTMAALALFRHGRLCVPTSDPNACRSAARFIRMESIVSTRTLSYRSVLVSAGNAVTKRFAHYQRLAKLALKAAGVFLIGFGIKLTIN